MIEGMVSIIVPVYNGAQYIEKTVKTLLVQSFRAFEILLINDGSSDNSAELIDELAATNEQVRVFHKANGGVANARNFGIEHAQGEFVAFCDQDDLWLEQKLEKQVPLFSNPDVGLVYCGAKTEYELYNKTRNPGFKGKKRGRVYDAMIQQNMLTCCTAVARKSAVAEVGGFDDDRRLMGVDDWHLWIKLSAFFEVDFVAENLAVHVFHGDNYSLNDKKMHDAELVCLQKIQALSYTASKNVNWQKIEHDLHLKYAKSYVFAGDFALARKAYFDAHRSLKDHRAQGRGLVLSIVPDRVLSALQALKRR